MGKHTLGELQHAIMRILWERREATVAEVHDSLFESRPLAPTTVATMLRKMEDKGVVRHRIEGRHFVYRPVVSEDAVRTSMIGELVNRLFEGDAAALVSHLVESGGMEDAELERLRALIDAADGRGVSES